MKKQPALLLAAILLLALCACGMPTASAPQEPSALSAEAPSAPVEVIVLKVILLDHGPDARDFFLGAGGFVERFEADNPDLRLELELVSRDEIPPVVDACLAGDVAPDILNIPSLSDLPPGISLIPAGDCCPEDLYGDFFPAFLAQAEVDGKVRALPGLASADALLCNAALLEEAGVEIPTTWAELETACEAILGHYGGEVIPLGLDLSAGGALDSFARFAWSNGGGFIGADGNWALNSPENAEAVEFAVGLVNKGFTNPNPAVDTQEDLWALFNEEKLAMLPASQELRAAAEGSDGGLRTVASVFPSGESGVYSALGSSDFLAVLRRDSAADEEARGEAIERFLQFLYDSENYAAWAESAGRTPASRAAAAAYAGSDSIRAAWAEALENSRSYPSDMAGWDDLASKLASLAELSLIGGDIRAGLDALQKELAP